MEFFMDWNVSPPNCKANNQREVENAELSPVNTCPDRRMRVPVVSIVLSSTSVIPNSLIPYRDTILPTYLFNITPVHIPQRHITLPNNRSRKSKEPHIPNQSCSLKLRSAR